jgi:hypothetical protein
MGRFCSTHGSYEKGRDHSKHLDVDGRVILEWILGK